MNFFSKTWCTLNAFIWLDSISDREKRKALVVLVLVLGKGILSILKQQNLIFSVFSPLLTLVENFEVEAF